MKRNKTNKLNTNQTVKYESNTGIAFAVLIISVVMRYGRGLDLGHATY